MLKRLFFLLDSSSPRILKRVLQAAIGLFALAVVLALWNMIASSRARDRVAAQYALVLSLEQLLTGALDLETGSRGFVLSGETAFLAPYEAARANLSGRLAEAEAAARRAGHGGGLGAVPNLVARKAESARLLVEERGRSAPSATALVITGDGKRAMDDLRAAITGQQAVATAQRLGLESRDRTRSVILTILSVLASFAACLGLGWLAWRRRRIAHDTSLELAGLNDRFRTLADNIPQLTWMATPDGTIYWYNQRWYDYTGLTPTDMIGQGWRKAHDPDYVDGVSQRFGQAIRSGDTWEDTFPLKGVDGEYRWFLSRAEPIRDERGVILRWFGTNTDITQNKLQEQELAAARDAAEGANTAKSQFLANMSHELRTPLSAVIGYSEMLEEEMEELGEQHLLDDLAKIKSNARHLLSLINDVLDISKIEANKMEVYAETFAVADMVKDVAATVDGLVAQKKNTLHVEAPDELGTMHTDVVKLRQSLINLLSNASKFAEDGDIYLSAQRVTGDGRDDLVFTVRDTGLGMSEEQVAKLFTRFTQADSSTTRRFGGTGLGLAITKAFTDMLGGTVAVESRLGEGSTFTVTIPATLTLPAETEDEVLIEVDGDNEGVVLIIDDDASTRDLLTRFLVREKFVVRSASDGRSGLALAQALKPRVILLDVTMPRMDGWEVLRSLKSDPALSAIPVVMCTIIDEKNLGFSLGAADYLLKPVDWERLKDVLARVEREAPKGDVLIVDDDADTRARLQSLMSKQGWTVTEAVNGRVALEAARKHSPALVMLDLNMPEMDGFTFLREFRCTPEWASVPVIVMTARDLSAGERAELKGGGARILAKGQTSMVELLALIRVLHDPHAPAAPDTLAPPDTPAVPAAPDDTADGPEPMSSEPLLPARAAP